MLSPQYKQEINTNYGSVNKFLIANSKYLQLSSDRSHVRVASVPRDFTVTEENVMEALRKTVPSIGYVRLAVVSTLLYRVAESSLLDILDSPTISQLYAKSQNQQNIWFVARREFYEAAIGEARFEVGDNTSILTAHCLMKACASYIPPYYVPFKDFRDKFSSQLNTAFPNVNDDKRKELLRGSGSPFARLCTVFQGALEAAYYGRKHLLFIRRKPTEMMELPPCVVEYPGFEITPIVLAKIVVRTPAVQTDHATVCKLHLYESQAEWVENVSMYTLPALCRMYPSLFDVSDTGMIARNTEHNIPSEVADVPESEFDEMWSKTETSTTALGEWKAHLEALASSPSENIFRPSHGRTAVTTSRINTANPLITIKTRDGTVVQTMASVMTDEEMIQLVFKCLPEDDEKVEIQTLMSNLKRSLSQADRRSFYNTLHFRYHGKISKFFRRHATAFIVEEHEDPTNNVITTTVSRNISGVVQSDHSNMYNPYLEESKLIEALRATWNSGVRGRTAWKSLSEISSKLPRKARDASRKYGMATFVQSHPDAFIVKFRLSGEMVVQLNLYYKPPKPEEGDGGNGNAETPR